MCDVLRVMCDVYVLGHLHGVCVFLGTLWFGLVLAFFGFSHFLGVGFIFSSSGPWFSHFLCLCNGID